MKLLITGGAGFLGINLIRYLLKKSDFEIVSLDIAPFNYPEANKITAITGDIRDPAVVTQAAEGVELVVHAAAALPLYKKEEIFSTDIAASRFLLDVAYGNGIKRLVYISSAAVYGIAGGQPLREGDELVGVGPYGEAKITAEKGCLKFRKKGMCVPIIRPRPVIGPERLGVFSLFYDWAKEGRGFPMIGNGHNCYQLLDVEDLCEAILLTLTLPPERCNDTFNIGAGKFTTMREDFQAVLDQAGFGKKIKGCPTVPMLWMLRLLELLKLSPLRKWDYVSAAKDSIVSIEKAEKELGFSPKYSNKEALIRNYNWYLENFNTFAKSSGVSNRVPWNQGILKAAKIFF